MEFYHGIKLITLMIYHIYHMLILGLLTKLTNFAFLQIANFGHFDTFPDGWVGGWMGAWVGVGGGWVKKKIKDQN